MLDSSQAQDVHQGCFAIKNGSIPKDYSGTSGNAQVDNITLQELVFMGTKMGVAPIFFFYNDYDGKNAYATDSIFQSNGPDGTVFFGRRLFNYEYISSVNGTAIPIVIAHEFGHIVDFKNGVLNEPEFRRELFADFFAGTYMSLRSREFKTTDVNGCYESFREMGDTKFGDPDFHGTPQQRGDALMAGYRAMERSYNNGAPLNLIQAIRLGRKYVQSIPLPDDPDVQKPVQ